MGAKAAVVAAFLIFSGAVAHSSEETPRRRLMVLEAAPALDGETSYLRAQSVFSRYQIEREEVDASIPQASASPQTIRKRLAYFDPTGIFSRFANVDELVQGASALRVYEDPRSLRRLDFEMPLIPDATERFHDRLTAISTLAASGSATPLKGLRIALDPGHMGGAYWDHETGKFARAPDGRELSEGLMVLQISRLLEKRFQELGAEVMLTHRELAPVTQVSYPGMDLTECEKQEFRANWLSPWFQALLARGEADSPALFQGFASSPEVRRIFSERMRWTCFVEREDLDARVRAIQTFEPDVVLIIHLDSDDPDNDSNGLNPHAPRATKTYVPGDHEFDELATREQRRSYAKHLLSPQSWDASVSLSHSIIESLSSKLSLEPQANAVGQAVVIEPGVQARNLRVLRKVQGAAISYVEALYYNRPEEFEALSARDHSMMIGGSNYPYSDRLDRLSKAIGDGVLSFVRNYAR